MRADLKTVSKRETPRQREHIHWATATALLMTGIVGNAGIALSPLLISGMARYLHYDDAKLGEVAAAASTGASLLMGLAIFFMDRKGWPLRATAVAALMAYAVINAIIPLTFASIGWLTFAFFLGGCSTGLSTTAAAAALTTLPNNARLISIFYGLPYLTGFIVHPFMPSLFSHWGVATAFWIIAGLSVLTLVVMPMFPARAVGAKPPNKGALAPQKILLQEQRGSCRSGVAFALLCVAVFLQYVANSGLWVYLDRIGILAGHSEQISANAVALGSGMAMGGIALATFFTPRLRPIPAIVGLTVIMAIGTLGLFGARNYPLFVASLVIFNGLITFVTPFYFIAISEKSSSPGRAAIIVNLLLMAGFAVGPFIIGRMGEGGDFTRAIFATVILFLISAFVAAGSSVFGHTDIRMLMTAKN